jgi:hypothetical protein
MSPIPKPPRQPSPVQKAVNAIFQQGVKPLGLIVHPSMDVEEVKAALLAAQPVSPVPEKRPPGMLVKHYERMKAEEQMARMQGRQVTAISWDEQHTHDVSELEKQLSDSLFALTEVVMPAAPSEIEAHTPHMQGSEQRIRRIHEERIDIFCPCKTVLRFNRCIHVFPDNERCTEEVPVVEAGWALCVFHRATNDEWLPGSRFFRCDYYDGSLPDGRCSQPASKTDEQGRHWCNKEGHIA